jgi:fermentation-respiration switch protein FrsA (DUF1100 family)
LPDIAVLRFTVSCSAIAACVALVGSPGCAALGRFSPTARLESYGIFQPAKYPKGDWQPTAVLVQDAYFTTKDGLKLHGWYVPHEQPKGHALLLHGNAGNVTLLAETLRLLNRRHGLAVLAVDYRGFGRSEGHPTEEGLYLDARAGRRWLADKEQIAESDVVLMGVSIGGAVAVDLAAKDGARGLVLLNTFTSLPAATQKHWPWLPMNVVLSTRMDSLSKIKNYQGPVLVAHSDGNEIVPYEQGEQLYNAAPGKKRFITLHGAKHNAELPEEYRIALDDFLASLPSLSREPVAVATNSSSP